VATGSAYYLRLATYDCSYFAVSVDGCAGTLGEGLPELPLAAEESDVVAVAVAVGAGFTSVALVFAGVLPAYFAAALSKGSEPAGGATAPVKMLRNDTMRP
jgi:hypothetical protein